MQKSIAERAGDLPDFPFREIRAKNKRGFWDCRVVMIKVKDCDH